MLDNVPRYDMKKPPMRMRLRALLGLLVLPSLLSHRNKLTKVGMEGIKPPYLLLCNHNAFMDMTVAIKATWPHRVNFVVAIDGFIAREWLLRLIGCICKRKFTHDAQLVRQLRTVIQNGDIAAVYPEARYSLCGTTAILPASIGKLAKFLKVPVVTLICHGHHVNSPFWNTADHKLKGTEATMTCLLSAEDVKALPHEEITARITEAFQYDDFAWQKENHKKITYKKRGEGLHKILYQCCECGTEYRMSSSGITLKCEACGRTWDMDEYGELHAAEGETRFPHIPDWYEWERANVRKEVEAGTYGIHCKATVEALPNAKKFIPIGEADLVHDMSGFTLSGIENGKPYEIKWPAASYYSVHIEYDYLGKHGDCVDLNTLKDTLYTYPEGRDFSITKMSLATEELYLHYHPQSPSAPSPHQPASDE